MMQNILKFMNYSIYSNNLVRKLTFSFNKIYYTFLRYNIFFLGILYFNFDTHNKVLNI